MKILAIDTSTKQLSLAVSDGDKIIRFRNFKLNKSLSTSLITKINRILIDSELSLNDIYCFVLGLGPGSFTSLRVGLSTIKAFSLKTKKKIIGISSMDAIAMNISDVNVQVCVVNDARRNMVYGCLYDKDASILRRKMEYKLSSINEIMSLIKGKAIFVGDGVDIYREEIERSSKCIRIEDKKLWNPEARRLITLAMDRYRVKDFDDASKLTPLYLYPDDCQVRK